MGKWETVRLGDVAKINMGQSPSSVSYNDVGEGMAFFQGKSDFGVTHPRVRMYCTDPKKIADKDDILISVRAPVGSVNIAAERCCIGRGIAAISQKPGVTNYNYLFRYLQYREKHIAGMGVGSTFKAINKKDLSLLEVPLPPLAVQQKIADALDRANDLIYKRKAQIDKLGLLIKSRFLEMFGDPVTNSKNLPALFLDDLATLKAGKNVVAKDIHELSSEYKYSCYGGNGIRGYVNMYSHEGAYPLIGRQGALCGNVQLADGRFFPTEHAVVVTPVKNYSVIWMFHCLDYLNLNRLQTGAAQPGLNIDTLKKVEIAYPSAILQNQFADFVQQVEAQKNLLQQSLAKLESNYKSLMQKCFRGEIF